MSSLAVTGRSCYWLCHPWPHSFVRQHVRRLLLQSLWPDPYGSHLPVQCQPGGVSLWSLHRWAFSGKPTCSFLSGRRNELTVWPLAAFQVRMVPPRWPSRTWPCSVQSQHALCFTPVTPYPQRELLSCQPTQRFVVQTVAPVQWLHDVGETLLTYHSFLRVSVSSVPADQTLRSSTPPMRSLKWAWPK